MEHTQFVIELTQGKFAIVDESTQTKLSRWKWFAWKSPDGSFYAARSFVKDGKNQRAYMHRQILGLTQGDGKYGDHVNGYTLDNRLCNLRIADASQSAANRTDFRNTSGYRGVSWCKSKNMWEAQLKFRGQKVLHSRHHIKEEAAEAYDAAAKATFGEFAILNFP